MRIGWTREAIAGLFALPFLDQVHKAHIFIGETLLTTPNAGEGSAPTVLAKLGIDATNAERNWERDAA